MTELAPLPDRGVLAIAGDDRVAFLNGLVSNDVAAVAPGGAVWAALLTAQGRYLADFFIFHDTGRLLLDAPAAAVDSLLRKFHRYRLRAAVALTDVSAELAVYAAWNGMPPEVAITAPDPRLREAGTRMLSPVPLAATAAATDYALHRLELGLPDGPPDLEPERTLLLEAGFDELNGVSWTKGCYMGQELTARTKYRGLVKRRLVPVALAGEAQPPGTPVLADGAEAGTLRSGEGQLALASLRLDALARTLTVNGAPVKPRIPAWMRLPG